MVSLARVGADIIRRERPDLVFFSTTSFLLFPLGRLWRAMFGVPYVLDYQDPWLNDYSGEQTGLYATRKYRVTQWLAGVLEPLTLRRVAGIVAVSPAYIESLRKRYRWLDGRPSLVLPFGGAERDFELAKASLAGWKNPIYDPADGNIHVVYAGRGGSDMGPALRALFTAFRRAIDADAKFRRVRFHFVGTSYAADRAEQTVEPIARECGVESFVEERTDRFPYIDTLRLLCSADALLIVGSDDRGYNASKLYPTLLAGRPLMAILHEESPATAILREKSGVWLSTFRSSDDATVVDALTTQLDSFIPPPAEQSPHDIELTAREMTHRLGRFFDSLLDGAIKSLPSGIS
jgi:hypothetical protein